ncbi:MAG TPA: TonB family protein [Acetobacteraceae bacterium]|nr:TonB family protein [Acetobacteraceae bacterium]
MRLVVRSKRERDETESSRFRIMPRAVSASERMAPPIGWRVMRSRPVIVSILFHILVLALVVVVVRPRRPPVEFVPPASVALVFENGGAQHATAPKAERIGPPEQAQPAPSPPALRPVQPRGLARALPPPPVQPPPVTRPPSLAQSAPVPQPVPEAPRPLAQAPAPKPAPQPSSPPAKLAFAAPPTPLHPSSPPRAAPSAVAPPTVAPAPLESGPSASEQQYSVWLPPSETQAFLQPPSLPAPRPFIPAPLPVPPTPPRHVPPPPPQPAVARPAAPAQRYLVLNNMSYGTPATTDAPAPQSSGRLNLALNQSLLNASLSRDFNIQGNIGPDWRAELTQWVNARKYYPEQALELGQQGSVMIRLVIARDGSVRDVQLLQSSGSPFLDSAWLGLFEGARLPPFPPGTPSNQITLEATMHYILVND